MFVTRTEGQSILIGDDVKVTVVDNQGWRQVRFGIRAPDHVVILREELNQDGIRAGTFIAQLVKDSNTPLACQFVVRLRSIALYNANVSLLQSGHSCEVTT